MTEIKAIIAIAVGSAAIVFGFTTKQFYLGRILGGPTASSSPTVARWKGRLLFVVVGVAFLLVGFRYFFYDVFH
jgi:hypothetical protein